MSYKAFRAIKVGTVALSVGITHFDPDRKDENGRYRAGLLPAADAARAEKKGLVELHDKTFTEKDYEQWKLEIAKRDGEEAGEDAGAARLRKVAEDDEDVATAAVSNLKTVAHPPGTPARDASVQTRVRNSDPDAAPIPESDDEDEDEGEGEGGVDTTVLKQSLPKLEKAIAKIDDVDTLNSLRTAEEKGQNRDGAKTAIDARIAQLHDA